MRWDGLDIEIEDRTVEELGSDYKRRCLGARQGGSSGRNRSCWPVFQAPNR